MRADADLPWYWGTGASTAAGDAGLRSPLGGQLEVLKAGIIGPRQVDASHAEESTIDRVGMGKRMRRIEACLRAMESPRLVEVLRRHYSGRSLPFGLSPAAVVLPICVRWVSPSGTHPQDLRGALHAATERQRRQVRADGDALVAKALGAYEAACRLVDEAQRSERRRSRVG